MPRRPALAAVVTALVGVGCLTPSAGIVGPRSPLTYVDALGCPVRGLSALALHPSGRLVSVGERRHDLTWHQADTLAFERATPLEGADEGLDLESLCFADARRFYVGTERHAQRTADVILVGELDGERARVVARIPVDYAALGITVEENHGIEGLACGDWGFALAIETPVGEGTDRRSPLVRLSPTGAPLAVEQVHLTTPTGKISELLALTTTAGVELFAIERHFGVARVLRFPLTPPRAGAVHEPRVELDLAAAFVADGQTMANLEGLAIVPPTVDGERIVFADDDNRGPPSPVHAVRYRPGAKVRLPLSGVSK